MYKEKWYSNFLAYYCGPKELKIKVIKWVVAAKSQDLYFIPRKNLKLIYNYYKEIGLKEVLKKIRSRRAEAIRNAKFLSVGIGQREDDGSFVAFFAPAHPMCVDELVLPRSFVFPLKIDEQTIPSNGELLFYNAIDSIKTPEIFSVLAGYSLYSGLNLQDKVQGLEEHLLQYLNAIPWELASTILLAEKPPRCPSLSLGKPVSSAKLSASVVGYGQYAKTNIIPNVKKFVEIQKIYEIDPTQIPMARGNITWSTAPFPELEDEAQVYFIAGYHHTHAPIAEHVIKKGAIAVVEKPVVVDLAQLTYLTKAIEESNGKLYSCYHKRYSLFNIYAKEDLGDSVLDPINYHCIVHEVPLPEKHWYRWPNSHSRIVSNGCHWIDHFLYLNDYVPPIYIDGFVSQDETYNCTIQLENGALFTMVLTDTGSSRVGVQDYIELRRKNVTVKIFNGVRYCSENNHKIIRRASVKKLQTYATMYSTIAQDLTHSLKCDSLKSLVINNQVMLDLERKLLAKDSVFDNELIVLE